MVDYAVFAVAVSGIRRLGPSFIRVTFHGDELENFLFAGLDQRIKLVFPGGSGLGTFPRDTSGWYDQWRASPEEDRCILRTYTVRAARIEQREVDVDFVVHGDTGPATRWVSSAAVGDDLLVIGPDVRTLVEADRSRIGGVEWNPGAAELVLLAGDETAAPAICSILESLPAEARGQAFIEVPTTGDVLPVPGPAGVTVTWLPRDAASPPHQGQLLDEAVRRWVGELNPGGGASPLAQLDEVDVDGEVLWEVPATEPAQTLYAWLAGEAGCIKELRRFLVRDTGLDRSSVAFMGYWRVGRSEN